MRLKPNNSSASFSSSFHRGAVADGQFSESYSTSSHEQVRSMKIRRRFPISPGDNSKYSLTFFACGSGSEVSQSSSQIARLRPTLRRAMAEQVSSVWKKSESRDVTMLVLLLLLPVGL